MAAWKSLIRKLNQNDTVVAQGYTILGKLNIFNMAAQKLALLVRTEGGSYRMLVKNQATDIMIRGLIQSPAIILHKYGETKYVQLINDSGVSYLGTPLIMYPEHPEKTRLLSRATTNFEEFIEKMKEKGDLPLLERCAYCGTIRALDAPECSDPACASEAEAEGIETLIRWIGTGIGVAIGLALLVPGLQAAFKLTFPFLLEWIGNDFGIFTIPITFVLSFYLFAYLASILYRSIRRIFIS